MRNWLVGLVLVLGLGCGDSSPSLLNDSSELDVGTTVPDTVVGQTDSIVFPGSDAGDVDQGACSPDHEDEPDPQFFDANCDGIDGDESQSVFVATYGDDANPGTKGLPKATVAAGIAAAIAEGKAWVLIGDSFYDGGFELAEGVNIAGGYGFGWKRDGRAKTTLRQASPIVTGRNIESPTTLMGLEVVGGTAGPGQTSVAIYLQSSPGVRLSGVRILGGKGGDGARGEQGATGSKGAAGAKGGDAPVDSGGFWNLDCINENSPPIRGAGGEPRCGSEAGRGGQGGRAGFDGASGAKGANGSQGTPGGAGGTAGSPGLAGKTGKTGMSGKPGIGGTATGTFVEGQWVGGRGVDGEPGEAGEGGSGGGGGGGGDDSDGLFNGCASWGGAGGGGGSGGCGGGGGLGGDAGGASVGLLLLDSDVFIEGCTIIGGTGGRGGDGGPGGEGGSGGAGGAGGDLEENSGTGGKGGTGGRGGRGGEGGGGAGGPSIGLFSDRSLSRTPLDTMITPGQGGLGGSAGGAAGKGADGVAESVRMP